MNEQAPGTSAPVAWQPLTFRGVAAFGASSFGRVLMLQLIVALLVSASIVWCLSSRYAPAILKAIQNLPEQAILQQGSVRGIPAQVLVENKFFSIVVDLESSGEIGQSADLQLELHRDNFRICSLLRSVFGCMVVQYPGNVTLSLSRSKLEPWWGAWKPMLLAGVAIVVVLSLFATWFVLATFYFPIARFLAYFADRQLPGVAGWKLASAALMPGALLMAFAILLYSWQGLDLIALLVITVLHVFIGWAYLVIAPWFAPKTEKARKEPNPFSC